MKLVDIAFDTWIAKQEDALKRASAVLYDWQEKFQIPQQALQQGAAMAEILAHLNLDADTIQAALLYPASRDKNISEEQVKDNLSAPLAKLVLGTEKMDAVDAMRPAFEGHEHYEQQLDNIRKMLLAMVEDVRVVIIKLAEQIYLLHAAKNKSQEEQQAIAIKVREIYAPLANRLGVGYLKWQLEDWAFRYLEPEQYKQIAKFIAEKREERQRAVEDVIKQLQEELVKDGVQAKVEGRVKHIYSIWRKMQRKNVQYEEVYDARAVRIVVAEVAQCYAALGTVHRLWNHIPKEFDDYIAQPKPNGYRSLHTAVVGPSGKALEVQIRTQQMHDESEMGVCAHWAYKEGGATDSGLQNKITWLRSLLDWQEEVNTADEVFAELQNNVTEDRVYVFTPKGEVFDLPKGATPIDFAYHVHTQVGHRTRGAKINGRIVPLTHQLKTGDQIEILTQNDAKPSRDWLNPDSGFIYTTRARAKVRAWFRMLHRDENIAEGRAIIEKECDRLDLPYIHYDDIAEKFNFKEGDEVLAAVGRGDLRLAQVIHAAYGHFEKQTSRDEVIPLQPKSKQKFSHGELTIAGVGNLLTVMAHCCHPVPGDSIIGYVTQGRGVSIHRQDCSNVINGLSESPERLLEVSWGSGSDKTYPVRALVKAYERKYLLRDITSVLSALQVNVTAIDSNADPLESTVTFKLTLEVPDRDSLGRVLDRLQTLPNIISASRFVEK
jgi:GTP pyrophosphokinase